jgi:TetR/AcrR family transcriptional regulator
MNGSAMMNSQVQTHSSVPAAVPDFVVGESRKRPKPGERRTQILETLARMLEQPGAERVTTAGLAAQLNVSEAALYRHFASKAQMFEGLIDFIETSVLSLVTQTVGSAVPGRVKAREITTAVLRFSEKNPGMTRVMVGDALVFENERLVVRMGQFFDQLEVQLRTCLGQSLAGATALSGTEVNVRASVLVNFLSGRMQRFARSEFKRLPTENLPDALDLLLG